jgi:hypothetical protein
MKLIKLLIFRGTLIFPMVTSATHAIRSFELILLLRITLNYYILYIFYIRCFAIQPTANATVDIFFKISGYVLAD